MHDSSCKKYVMLGLKRNRKLPKKLIDAIKTYPKNALPMEALRTSVSLLSLYEKHSNNFL